MRQLAVATFLLPFLAAIASAQDLLQDEEQRAVSRVAFSPDGKLLASGGVDGILRLWDLDKKAAVQLTGHSELTGLAFLPDGKQIVTCDFSGKVKLWDVASKKELKGFDAPGGLLSVAVSPDGKKAYLGSRDDCIYVWELQKAPGEDLPKMKSDHSAYNLEASRDGKVVVHSDGRGSAYLWNAASGDLLKQVKHKLSTVSIAIAPDGQTFVSAGQDGGVLLWDAASGAPRTGFSNAEADIRSVAFTPDGKKLMIGTADGRLKALDAATGALLKSVAAHECPINALAVSPDGKSVVTGGTDFKIKVWSTP